MSGRRRGRSLSGPGVALALALLSLAVPLTGAAPPARTLHRIGVLTPVPPEFAGQDLTAAVQSWLGDLGYVEGTNVRYDNRFGVGGDGRLPGLAAELVALNVDLILAYGVPAALAARDASPSIPVVVCIRADPARVGLIDGADEGRISGVTTWSPRQVRRRVALLREAVPDLKRLTVLANPADLDAADELAETTAAARDLGLTVQTVDVASARDLAAAAETSSHGEAVLVLADRLMAAAPEQVTRLLMRARRPAMYSQGHFVEGKVFAGGVRGLMAYGASSIDIAQELALAVDRVLNDGQAGAPRIVRPVKFELVVDLKTARALGVTIPGSLLERADRVIE